MATTSSFFKSRNENDPEFTRLVNDYLAGARLSRFIDGYYQSYARHISIHAPDANLRRFASHTLVPYDRLLLYYGTTQAVTG